MNKLGQEPAFPQIDITDGMSKRFYAACAVMQGLLANSQLTSLIASQFKDIDADKANSVVVKAVYDIADELLKQENENG